MNVQNMSSQPTCIKCGDPVTPDHKPAPVKGLMAGYCINCTSHEIYTMWTNAHEWDQLVQYNYGFLTGDYWGTPYCSKLLDETNALIPGLLKPHEYGALTIMSQPFQHSIYFDTKEVVWAERKQCPELSIMLPTVCSEVRREQILRVVEILLLDERVVTTAWSQCHQYPPRSRKDPQITVPLHLFPEYEVAKEVQQEIYNHRTSKPGADWFDWLIAKIHRAPLEEDSGKAKWFGEAERKAYPSIHNHTESRENDLNSLSYAMLKATPIIIEVIARNWDDDFDIVGWLEEQLKAAGMARIYPDLN